MPLYDYRCDACENDFEESKRIAEREEPVDCPKCGKRANRVLSGFAVGSSSSSGGFNSSGISAAAGRAACGFSGG